MSPLERTEKPIYIVVFTIGPSEEVYYCKSIPEVREKVDRIIVSEEDKKKFRVFKAQEIEFGYPENLGLPPDFEYTMEHLEQDLKGAEEVCIKKKGKENQKNDEEWFVIKRWFYAGDGTYFEAETVWPERVFSKYDSDVKELLNEGYIESLPAKKDY